MKKFHCPIVECESSYTRRRNLKTHFENHHPDEIIKYIHIFISTKSTKVDKLWSCPLKSCPCGYSRKGDLKFHMEQKHKNIAHKYPKIMKSKSTKVGKRYPCPDINCNRGYMRKSDLKRHHIEKHGRPLDIFDTLNEHEDQKPTEDTTEKTKEYIILTSICENSKINNKMSLDFLLATDT